jgi:hypothetical protein
MDLHLLKTFGASSAGMPGPLSVTEISTRLTSISRQTLVGLHPKDSDMTSKGAILGDGDSPCAPGR